MTPTSPTRGGSDLEHQLLIARDEIVGLKAENHRLRLRQQEYDETTLGEALTRLDRYEDEREALVDHIGRLRIEFRQEVAQEVARIQASTTYRAGRLILAPARRLARVLRRS